MPRILINCPAGRGAVPTGYRTADLDLAAPLQLHAFRCLCGEVHTWSGESAWAEEGVTTAALHPPGPVRPAAA
jgi:hypothetical protein